MLGGVVKGLQQVLAGATASENISRDDYYCQPNGQLPDMVVVHIDKCRDLYKPTYLAKVKMDPYVAVYLQSKKAWRVATSPVSFGGANPTINKEIRLPYTGEPMLVVQVFAKEPIRDEFIGECPLDLLPVINSTSRSWRGPVTVYGSKGTVVRGEVVLSLTLRGGTPFDPRMPACRVGQLQKHPRYSPMGAPRQPGPARSPMGYQSPMAEYPYRGQQRPNAGYGGKECPFCC